MGYNRGMNFQERLNNLTSYIEEHLTEELSAAELGRRIGLSAGSFQRIFSLLAGIGLAEYLRKRRLTMAGRDLVQRDASVTDTALKYGYDSTEAFSRAFTKFHGIKPSAARTQASQLKYYPVLEFHTPPQDDELTYEVVDLPAFTLYGTYVLTDASHINHDAPELFRQLTRQRAAYGEPDYGMVVYRETRDSEDGYEYWVLWRTPHPELTTYEVRAGKYLKFQVPSQNERAIQSMSNRFYEKFLPTCCYELSPEPELEHYHDGVTDLLMPLA